MTMIDARREDRGHDKAMRYALAQGPVSAHSARTCTELPRQSAEPETIASGPAGLRRRSASGGGTLAGTPARPVHFHRPGESMTAHLEGDASGLDKTAVSPNRWGVLAVLRSLIHLLMCSLDQTYREESLEVRSTAQYDSPSGGRSSSQKTAPSSRAQSTTEVFHVQP